MQLRSRRPRSVLSRRLRFLVVALAMALVAAACSGRDDDDATKTTDATSGSPSSGAATSAAPTTPKEAPLDTEVGVTATTISIAVIADNDTPLAPGLFKGSADAVLAFEKWINANGGIAGRQLKVNYYDSKLNPEETRNAIIKACANDFAMVGTTALFVNNVDDMVGCKDKAGGTPGLPDIPELTTDPSHQKLAFSFPILPAQRDWAQPDKEIYRDRMGPYFYLQTLEPKLHGLYIYAADLASTKVTEQVTFSAMQKQGIVNDATGDLDASGRFTQSQYTPFIQLAKDKQSNFFQSGLDYTSTVKARKEAKAQGVDIKYWYCTLTCYSAKFLAGDGDPSVVEGTYVTTFITPYEEADTVPNLQAYIDSIGGLDKVDGFGVQAWTAALLFKESIEKLVEAKGVNGITRAGLIDVLKNTREFTGGGIIGTSDIAGKVPGPCHVMLQVQNNKFVRVFPTEKGKFDCDPKNVVTHEESFATN